MIRKEGKSETKHKKGSHIRFQPEKRCIRRKKRISGHYKRGTSMKLIYVAGKYNDISYSKIEDNIRKAERASIKLIQNGWAVITPHKNTAHYEIYESILNIDNDFWIEMDLEILKRCDAIFFLFNWIDSIGCKKELLFAEENNIKIYYEGDSFPYAE